MCFFYFSFFFWLIRMPDIYMIRRSSSLCSSVSLPLSPGVCVCVCPNLDTVYSLTKIQMVWGPLLQQGIKTYVLLDTYLLNRQIMWHFVKEEECLDSKMHKKIYVDRMANRLNSWHPKVSKGLHQIPCFHLMLVFPHDPCYISHGNPLLHHTIAPISQLFH